MGAYKMCLLAEKNNKDGTDITLKEDYASQRVWKMPVYGGVFNVFEYLVGFHHEERKKVMPFPTGPMFGKFLVALVLPFIPYYKVLSAIYPKPASKVSNMILAGVYGSMFILWVALFASMGVSPGLRGFAWTAFVICGCTLTHLRSAARESLRVQGNMFYDFGISLFLYPQVILQLEAELEENDAFVKEDVEA